MKLQAYLTEADLTVEKFAELIEVHRTAVQRYIDDQRIPGREKMAKIVEVTAGKVTANDFYGIPA